MRSATVWMHNQVAGRLFEALSGEVVFEYEPGYAAQPQAHLPISRTIPLASRGTAGWGLHPFFDGLIPEGWLLQLTYQHHKLKPTDRLGLLLATGANTVGACCVMPHDLPPPPPSQTEPLPLDRGSIVDIDLGMDTLEQWGLRMVQAHIGLTGWQPKLSIELAIGASPKRYTIPDASGGYILKPPTAEYPELPQLEWVAMQLAQCVGLRVAQHTLVRLATGELAYLTRRFDRQGSQKVHQEDFAQLLGVPSEQKYAASYEAISRIISRYSSSPNEDLKRLLECLVFCFVTGNSDMHLKNFSLQYPSVHQTVLSPFYDLVPVALVLPQDTEDTALMLNGRKKPLTRENFQRFCAYANLPLGTLSYFIDLLPDKLPEMQALIYTSPLAPETQERLAGLVASRLARLAA